MARLKKVLLLGGGGLLLLMCGLVALALVMPDREGGPAQQAPRMTATAVPTATQRPTVTAVPIAQAAVGRCVPASAAQMAALRDGVKAVAAGNDLLPGYAVRSTEFARGWLVAARITGAGIPAAGAGPGVWAMGGEADAPAGIYAVNGFAREFTHYPDAAKTDAAITLTTDGVTAALECAR